MMDYGEHSCKGRNAARTPKIIGIGDFHFDRLPCSWLVHETLFSEQTYLRTTLGYFRR